MNKPLLVGQMHIVPSSCFQSSEKEKTNRGCLSGNTGDDRFGSIPSFKSGWKRVKGNFNYAGGYHGGLIKGLVAKGSHL